jgi:ATP citrate (pro-S)-lyase
MVVGRKTCCETRPTRKTVIEYPIDSLSRGKLGLVKLNCTFEDARVWIGERMGKSIEVEGVPGVLDTFIIEPFVPHKPEDEYYIAITGQREHDEILFYHQGGIEVGDVEEKAEKLLVPVGENLSEAAVKKMIFKVPEERQAGVCKFLIGLYNNYRDLYFSYLEINPFVLINDVVYTLDTAAKLDQTAHWLMNKKWGNIDFPAPFGTNKSKAEKFIESLDSKTGASLKLTILNAKGRVWTMIAGGGASVVFADTIVDLGFGHELANYGEYSGDPSETETYHYAKTVLNLMIESGSKDPILIIGGGIANFTNVADTFRGIVTAIRELNDLLISRNVKIFVRRGGPNYSEGLRMMYDLGIELGIPIDVYGPESHITSICSLALGIQKVEETVKPKEFMKKSFSKDDLLNYTENYKNTSQPSKPLFENVKVEKNDWNLFTSKTRSIVYGLQMKAVQGMLDFDYICKRTERSVACIVYPFSGNHYQKIYWGTNEILLPIYEKMEDALKKYPDVDTVVNFASSRSVFDSTKEMLSYSQVRTVAIIAEGVPENQTRLLLKEAKERKVTIIGPATVGGIMPGSFKIGNTGGMIDNIIASKLYRPGSVAYVSKSGGMSNELNNIISRSSNGVVEGIACGGDKYPCTTFIDHLLRYEKNPNVKILVLLGEVGGLDEYDVCAALKDGRITKPLVAWCVGTCAKIFPYNIQFGHAGASATGTLDTADAKNKALTAAGAFVPKSFEGFGDVIKRVYNQLVKEGKIVEFEEPPVPSIPMDFGWAVRLGLVRKPTSFTSSISDERGEELLYGGMPISSVFKENIGVGGVLGLLWFKKRLPDYACEFIEMILCLTADHGPAVSGAHNCIVTARSGKDLISSLTSGLLTIGPRFGGALDDAAVQFSSAYDSGLTPFDFVEKMKKEGQLIGGIGHKIKSVQNPDKRVTIIKEFANEKFKKTPLLDYALEVEKLTTAKKPNLILNVDGAIAVLFVDLLRESGSFTTEGANDYVKMGCLNGLFVLGRTIGFIGHYLDQKRLKQGLYRHPWEDISYLTGDEEF